MTTSERCRAALVELDAALRFLETLPGMAEETAANWDAVACSSRDMTELLDEAHPGSGTAVWILLNLQENFAQENRREMEEMCRTAQDLHAALLKRRVALEPPPLALWEDGDAAVEGPAIHEEDSHRIARAGREAAVACQPGRQRRA